MANILWVGNSFLGSPFKVGCNYYVESLAAQGHHILFVTSPISPLHKWFRPDGRTQQAGICVSLANNLDQLVPFTWCPPLKSPRIPGFYIRYASYYWPQWASPSLQSILNKVGFSHVDTMIIDCYQGVALLPLVAHQQLLVRVTDCLAGFRVHPEAIAIEKELISKADHVFYTAQVLAKEIKAYNDNITYLPNGVDKQRFLCTYPKPQEYTGLDGPIAVYVGAMDWWFDYEGLSTLIYARTDVQFVLIGPPVNIRGRLPIAPNLHLLGVRSPEQIPAYLQHANVGLIPFNIKRHGSLIESVNPLKLYEYIAAGLPVVSARWSEIEKLSEDIYFYEDDLTWDAALSKALTSGPINRAEARQFAQAHDWNQRASQIATMIERGIKD